MATPDVAQMYSGGQLQVDPRANDSDPDGEALTVTSAVVTSGAGTVTTDGQVLAIGAAAGFVGPLVVTYAVSDPRGGQAQSTVTVDVITAPNRPPVAGTDAVSVKVGRTYRIPVLANDSDPDGDRLTLVKVGKAKHGTARRSGSKVVYRAPKSWTGTTKVAYTVRDAAGATTRGTLTITVERRTPVAKPTPKPKPTRRPLAGDGPSKADVESALARLGLPTGSADGRYDARTRRAVCAWRTVTGRPDESHDTLGSGGQGHRGHRGTARGPGLDGHGRERVGHLPGGVLGRRQPGVPPGDGCDHGQDGLSGPGWGRIGSS